MGTATSVLLLPGGGGSASRRGLGDVLGILTRSKRSKSFPWWVAAGVFNGGSLRTAFVSGGDGGSLIGGGGGGGT